jgi:hypothetical protein
VWAVQLRTTQFERPQDAPNNRAWCWTPRAFCPLFARQKYNGTKTGFDSPRPNVPATQTDFFIFLAHAQVAGLSWAGFSWLDRGVLNAPNNSGVVLETTGVLYR